MPVYALQVRVPYKLAGFVHDEVDWVLQQLGVDVAQNVITRPSKPFVYNDVTFEVRLADDATAMAVLKRSMLVRFVYRVWGAGTTLEEALAQATATASTDPTVGQALALPYSVKVDATCTHPHVDTKSSISASVTSALVPTGPIRMKDPDSKVVVHISTRPDHGLKRGCSREELLSPTACARVRVTLRLGESGMPAVEHRLSLKKRAYLGPTSLETHLSMLMCSMAGVPGSSTPMYVYDPFGGTGSILVTAAALGAHTLGSEIDVRVLVGKAGATLATNFHQYGLPAPEQFRGDNSAPPFHQRPLFDAIVTDPPYGIRAAAKKTGAREGENKDIPEEMRDGHIPKTQVYHPVSVMGDLLSLAARTLVMGGRLVYLLPSTVHYRPEELPVHPCLTLCASVEQQLGLVLTRRCVVMQKTREWVAADAPAYAAAAEAAQAAAAVLGVDCNSIVTRLDEATRAQNAAVKGGKSEAAAVADLSGRQKDTIRRRNRRAEARAAGKPRKRGRGGDAAPASPSAAAAAGDVKRQAGGAAAPVPRGMGKDATREARHTTPKYDIHLLDPAVFAKLQKDSRAYVAQRKAANGGRYVAFGEGGRPHPGLHIPFPPAGAATGSG